MKISIIIPVYNVEPYVGRCVESVMRQTYQDPMECLVVDDCGTDMSMDVVKRMVADYHGHIHFKILHHNHNRGLSAARNTGMEAATGDYLFFLDSDDEITTDCIEKLTAPLAEEIYDIVVGNIKIVGGNEHHDFLKMRLSDGTILRRKEIEKTYRKEWNMIAPNKLYRLDFIREQGLQFKEGLVHEDELWSLQVACLAQSLRAVNHSTYIYYVREGSITTSTDVEVRRCKMLKVIVEEICTFLRERNIFSVRAYQLMQKFFWQAIEPSLYHRDFFIEEYCSVRKVSIMPIAYRVRACGLHPRAQLQNLYYLMPSHWAARLLFRSHKKS